MPSLKKLLSDFSISSTDLSLDCFFFDKLKSNSGYDKAYSYSCHAISPNTTTDVATHWHPASLPTVGKVFIALAAILVAALSIIWWWYKWGEPKRERAKAAAQARENGTELRTVVKRDPNEPPLYTRVGKPGEVPPGYHETHEVQLTGSQSSSSWGEPGVEPARTLCITRARLRGISLRRSMLQLQGLF
jgi:hypothetical protein